MPTLVQTEGCECKDVKPFEQFPVKKNGKPYAYCFACHRGQANKRYRKKIGREVKERPPTSPEGFKWYSTCKKMKPLESFRTYTASTDDNSALCKACAKKSDRKTYLKRQYGITPSEYDAMLQAQGGLCAICRKPETVVHMGKTPHLSVDHCHRTGTIRGLLCYKCNYLVGYLDRYSAEDVATSQAYRAKYATNVGPQTD